MKVRIHNRDAQRAYEAMKWSGARGRELAQVLAERRTRVVVSRFMSGGFTLTALNMIFLQPLRANAGEREFLGWVALLGHEASHIEQNFWTDSIEQEMRAYTDQVRIAQELGIDLGVITKTFDTLNPDLAEHRKLGQQAMQRLFGQTPAGVLYAALPLGQPRGVQSIFSGLTQMGALVRAAFYRQAV